MEKYLAPGFGNDNIKYLFLGRDIKGSTGNFRTDREPDLNIVKANEEALRKAVGCDRLSFMNQKHTNFIVNINAENYLDSESIYDGQITQVPGIALVIQTADCVPIIFADYNKNIIAAIHAGWRGARADIILNTIIEMKKRGAEDIHACIGPCIRQETYEVDIDFYNNFIAENTKNSQYFIESSDNNDRFMFDLPAYVTDKLYASGINKVFDTKINTYPDNNLYSFRRFTHRGGDYGSNISVIYIDK